MTKNKIQYSKNLNYKIVCKNQKITDLYVGRTTDFTNRKYLHKCDCNRIKTQHLPLYKCINENGGWNNWDMILIEQFPCNNGTEARQREHQLSRELNSNLNKNKCIITDLNNNPIIMDDNLNYKERNKLMSKFRHNTNHLKVIQYENEIIRLKQLLLDNNIQY